MSELVGTIGQKYENRKSGKQGILVDRDEGKKVLQFLDKESGQPFSVTFLSFKSNWRKATNENGDVEPVDAEVVAAVATDEHVDSEVLIDKFVDEVGKVRDIRFTANPKSSEHTDLIIDGITAMSLDKDDGGIRIQVLPDLYTYSDIRFHVLANTIHFNAENHMSVSFVSDYATFGEILSAITQAAIDINLYGYTID